MTKQFSREDIINLLIKQASGFYYAEEQYEYEKTQNKTNLNKISTISSNILTNFAEDDRGETQISLFDDTLKLANENTNAQIKNDKNLTLVKKKIATHYVSPDMQAIKILLEIFPEKIDDNFDSISDEELLSLKNKLIGELLNEPVNDQQNHQMWHSALS